MKYYFIDDEVYFQNKKMPAVKRELYNVEKYEKIATGYDIDGNLYEINISQLIEER